MKPKNNLDAFIAEQVAHGTPRSEIERLVLVYELRRRAAVEAQGEPIDVPPDDVPDPPKAA
jgi:hypothetical protein